MGAVTAIVGGAVIAAAAGVAGAAIASGASDRASRRAADAAIQGTNAQVNEIRRQYDQNLQLMLPFIQGQYSANAAMQDLLGISGYGPQVPDFLQPGGGPQGPPTSLQYRGGPPPADPTSATAGSRRNAAEAALARQGGAPDVATTTQGLGSVEPNVDVGGLGGAGFEATRAAIERGDQLTPQQRAEMQALEERRAQQRNFFAQGGQEGGFRDPNLNPITFGEADYRDTEVGRQVTDRMLAGDDPDEDLAIRRARETALYAGVDADSLVQRVREEQLRGDIGQRLLAGGTLAEDERFAFTRDTAVVGDTFEESPGYQFQLEETLRASDRALSRGGGNYGGRAAIEAQRRAQGVAAQDYYNYVGARQADLRRSDQAAAAFQARQALDAQRLDSAAQYDISRGDAAVQDARRREELDLQRGDIALGDYLERRNAQIAREDAAVYNNQTLRQQDVTRQDQGYYNYLNYLAGLGGAGNPVGQATQLGAGAAQQIGGALGAQGNQLAQIYGQNAANQGNIWANAVTNVGQQAGNAFNNYFWAQQLGYI